MQKYFCDFCKSEVKAEELHRITFEKLVYDKDSYRIFECCEKCYKIIENNLGVKK